MPVTVIRVLNDWLTSTGTLRGNSSDVEKDELVGVEGAGLLGHTGGSVYWAEMSIE